MRELAPQFQIPWSIPLEAEDIPIVPTTSGTMYALTSRYEHHSPDNHINNAISISASAIFFFEVI